MSQSEIELLGKEILDLRAALRREQDARAALRVELDRMKAEMAQPRRRAKRFR